jgi:peptidyl-prolyl cis-trans isomerase SurA
MNNPLISGRFPLFLWCMVVCFPCRSAHGQTEVPRPDDSRRTAQMASSTAEQRLDRAVAMVNGYLILESDIDRERNFESLDLNGETDRGPSTAGAPKQHGEVIERLIDRQLILQQVARQENSGGLVQNPDTDLSKVTLLIPDCAQGACSTLEGWDHFLTARHFTQESFRQYWQQRLMVLSFVEQRFRSGVRPDPNAIDAYYRETFLPRFERSHATAPPLSTVANQIGDVLIEQDISSLLSDWLKTLRTQSNIVVFQAGKEKP